MEDWKLPREEAEIFEEAQDIHHDIDEVVDPVEQIHHRRHSSPKQSVVAVAAQMHTIPIESRYHVINDEDDDEEEPDIFLKHLKDSPHTLMDKQCIAQDVISIWEAISEYIILKLKRGLGTIIPGLGTFTYHIKNVAFPKSKMCKLHIYPKFFISGYVAEMYRLKESPSHHSNVPCKLINLSVIAKRINIPRPTIEGAVTEVLQAFARGLVCNKNIEFPFPCIGKLRITNQRIQMRFYLDFYKNLKYNIEVPSVLVQNTEQEIQDLVIEGRMTPLVYHIPQPNYRSVFHLREVRSVHEAALLAPIEYHKGRLIPQTLIKNEVEKELLLEILEKQEDHFSMPPSVGISEKSVKPPSSLSHMGPPSRGSKVSFRSEIEEIVANRKSRSLSPNDFPESVVDSALTGVTGTESDIDEASVPLIYNPKPLYLEQETGIEIIDKRLEDPEYFTKELEKYVLGDCVKTLGFYKAYAHLKRAVRVHPQVQALKQKI